MPLPTSLTSDPNGNPSPTMQPVTFYADDTVRVSATLVQHGAMFPAFAYRFDTDDGSVVFSGDTSPSDNLITMAQGADVLVHEVIAAEWAESLFPFPRTPQQDALLEHPTGAHTTTQQVGQVAKRAGVETLVLNHLVPGNWPEERFARAGRELPRSPDRGPRPGQTVLTTEMRQYV